MKIKSTSKPWRQFDIKILTSTWSKKSVKYENQIDVKTWTSIWHQDMYVISTPNWCEISPKWITKNKKQYFIVLYIKAIGPLTIVYWYSSTENRLTFTVTSEFYIYSSSGNEATSLAVWPLFLPPPAGHWCRFDINLTSKGCRKIWCQIDVFYIDQYLQKMVSLLKRSRSLDATIPLLTISKNYNWNNVFQQWDQTLTRHWCQFDVKVLEVCAVSKFWNRTAPHRINEIWISTAPQLFCPHRTAPRFL